MSVVSVAVRTIADAFDIPVEYEMTSDAENLMPVSSKVAATVRSIRSGVAQVTADPLESVIVATAGPDVSNTGICEICGRGTDILATRSAPAAVASAMNVG